MAITFSGFNSIDFNVVLQAIMTQERQPLALLEGQKTALQTQNTAFGTLATRLNALRSAADTLAKSSSLSGLTATSSDAGVGVSTTSGAIEGTYEVVVSELARAQVTASASTYSGVDAIVATGGTLTLAAAGTTSTVEVGASMTLKELASAINKSADSPVTASIVQAAPGAYRLVLTSKQTGADNGFTVGNTFDGGEGLAFVDTDGDGVSGNTAADNVQNASNAAFTVNGLSITSASNTVSDAVPGVTLTLLKKDPNKTVIVSASRDATTGKARIKEFVSAYNALASFINEQGTAAAGGKANIARDPLVRGLRDSLRTTLSAVYGDGEVFTRLAAVGIGLDATGKLVLDESRFAEALAANQVEVQALFSGENGNAGAFGALRTLVDSYTQSGGLVADTRKRLDSQVRSITRRLDMLEQQLEQRRLSLQQEFIATDRLMSQLNSQGNSLGSLGGQYRLF